MADIKFRDRVRLAWRVFSGSKGVVTTFSEIGWQGSGETDISFEAMVGSGYHKNELIYACISKKANTAAQIELSVSAAKDADVNDNHPLKLLIQQPNPYMSEYDFWAAVCIYQSLAGRAIFEKERNRGGKVIALWPLRPDWITTVRDGNRIAAYEYQPPGIGKITLDAKNVVDFKLFDPLGMFSVWSPVAVAARVGDADNAATDHIKNIWEHGGVPAGMIKTTQRLIEAQVENIQRQWMARYGGRDNWQKPMVFDSDAEYQKIGFSFAELGFDVLDARSEARICMVLDVPPILVGAKIGLDRSTMSNYREARMSWWQDSLIPMYESYIDVIQNQLAFEFGSPFVEWNYSNVPALQEDQNARWTRATTALNSGGITVNEFCAQVGLEDKGPAGEYYLRSMAIVEVPAKTGRKPDVEPVEPEPVEEVEPIEEEPEDEEEMPQDEEKKKLREFHYSDDQPRDDAGRFTDGGSGGDGGGEGGGGDWGDAIANSTIMSPDDVTPFNTVTSQEKYERIKSSMEKDGWKGAPILAYKDGDNTQAITGSHRIFAARDAGIDVPVSIMDFDGAEYDDISDFLGSSDTESFYRAMQNGDYVERGFITQEQFDIMKNEYDSEGDEKSDIQESLEKYIITLDELQDRYRMAFKVKPTPDEIRRKHERIITADMKSYFSDELSRIKKAISGKGRSFIRQRAAAREFIVDMPDPGLLDIGAGEIIPFDRKGLTDIANAFWEHEDEILWKLLLKRLLASTLSGAMIALDGLMEIGVGVEWALVNQAAIAWASKYSYQLVKQINDTSQKFLQSAIPEWINSGAPLDVLIEQLAPTFGEVRASMIGVTEVTRSYAEGNKITWKESGVVQEHQWRTAEDELVCPICGDSEEGKGLDMEIAPIDGVFRHPTTGEEYEGPPAHINCRCFLSPLVEL